MAKNRLYTIIQHFFQRKSSQHLDPYTDFANPENHTWIYREHEIHEQLPPILFRTHSESRLAIGEILSQLFSIQQEEISDLSIIENNKTTRISDKHLIWNHDVLSTYYKDQENPIEASNKHIFYTLLYRDSQKRLSYKDKSIHHNDGAIMMHCYPAGKFKEQTSYLHIAICVPTNSPTLSQAHKFEETAANCKTLTVAYDFKRPSQALAEYTYIKESIKNYADLKLSALTANEWALLEHIHPEIGNEFYWGKKAFNENRYMDAILYFTNIYNTLRDIWYKKGLNTKEMSLLTECSYLIGYSYNDLRLYDKAYHYLELAGRSNSKSYKYKKEFINCLVNSRDLLSIIYIDDYLQDLKNLSENKRDEDDLAFFHFLLRRKAYILIEMDQLDDAEFILHRLLEKDPDNLIVLKELAFIQYQRKQNESATKEREEKKQQS